jgi:hypothetical protein
MELLALPLVLQPWDVSAPAMRGPEVRGTRDKRSLITPAQAFPTQSLCLVRPVFLIARTTGGTILSARGAEG